MAATQVEASIAGNVSGAVNLNEYRVATQGWEAVHE
jgi:hypothetical protein